MAAWLLCASTMEPQREAGAGVTPSAAGGEQDNDDCVPDSATYGHDTRTAGEGASLGVARARGGGDGVEVPPHDGAGEETVDLPSSRAAHRTQNHTRSDPDGTGGRRHSKRGSRRRKQKGSSVHSKRSGATGGSACGVFRSHTYDDGGRYEGFMVRANDHAMAGASGASDTGAGAGPPAGSDSGGRAPPARSRRRSKGRVRSRSHASDDGSVGGEGVGEADGGVWVRHGKGTFTDAAGNVFQGMWVDDQATGCAPLGARRAAKSSMPTRVCGARH